MIIAGTGGLGLEILGILIDNDHGEIVFYDENPKAPEKIFGKYRVIKNAGELQEHFRITDPAFVTGIGNPRIREKVTRRLKNMGGNLTSVVSKRAGVFQFNTIPPGTIIHPYVLISHHLDMGEGCALHAHSSIGHAAQLGKYINVAPGVSIIGPIEIGDYTYIAAGAVILPHIRIGKNVVISAGAVVKNDVPDFATVE
jgi:sugar O-acyltransferase (sialic acid O-acetyltransferase NeuD family)